MSDDGIEYLDWETGETWGYLKVTDEPARLEVAVPAVLGVAVGLVVWGFAVYGAWCLVTR